MFHIIRTSPLRTSELALQMAHGCLWPIRYLGEAEALRGPRECESDMTAEAAKSLTESSGQVSAREEDQPGTQDFPISRSSPAKGLPFPVRTPHALTACDPELRTFPLLCWLPRLWLLEAAGLSSHGGLSESSPAPRSPRVLLSPNRQTRAGPGAACWDHRAGSERSSQPRTRPAWTAACSRCFEAPSKQKPTLGSPRRFLDFT